MREGTNLSPQFSSILMHIARKKVRLFIMTYFGHSLLLHHLGISTLFYTSSLGALLNQFWGYEKMAL